MDRHPTAKENYILNEVFETLDAAPKVVSCPVIKYGIVSPSTPFSQTGCVSTYDNSIDCRTLIMDRDTLGTWTTRFRLVTAKLSSGYSPTITYKVVCLAQIDDPYNAQPIEVS